MSKNKLIASVGVLIVAGIASSYASPYLTMHQMRTAMLDQDADAFSSHVDFPAVRESVRAQFMMMIQNKLANSPEMKDSAFSAVGMMLGMGIVNQMIDTMVTPAGVMTMMAQAGPKTAAPATTPAALESDNAKPAQKVDYSISYKDWSTVSASAKKGAADPVVFVFKRDGLWSWKLSGVNLPADLLKG